MAPPSELMAEVSFHPETRERGYPEDTGMGAGGGGGETPVSPSDPQ